MEQGKQAGTCLPVFFFLQSSSAQAGLWDGDCSPPIPSVSIL